MKPMRVILVLVILTILPGTQLPIHAQTVSDFQSRAFTSSTGNTLRYRLLVPKNYDSSQSYPIVMFLHGGQQRGKAKWTRATACGARFCGQDRRQAKHPCFVLVPHAPGDDNWGSVFEGGPSRTLLAAMEVLDALEIEFNIDKSREHITGLSGGGKGTWVAFLSHPGRFAAAIPLCARQSVKPEEANLTNYAKMAKELPIWMWHGAKDQKNEVANSRVMFKALQNVGANAKYTEVPDAPHNCWDVAYSSDELHDWLFAQSLPESISVEPQARVGRRDAVTKSNRWRVEDHPSDFKPRTFTHPSRGELNYRLFVPKNYDPNRSYPIVVFLHGMSRRGSDNSRQINTPGAMVWTTPEIQSRHPCFVLAPQAPADSGWGCPAMLPEMMAPIRNVLAVLDSLEKEFSIDTRREYIAGQSGGGGGASAAIMAYPKRFAAAILVCPANRGQTWTPDQAELIAHMPLWFFHGAVDRIVDMEVTRTAVRLLKEAGGHPNYTEYPNAKHNCWERAFPTRKLHEWLFSQTASSPSPQDVSSVAFTHKNSDTAARRFRCTTFPRNSSLRICLMNHAFRVIMASAYCRS